MKMKKEKIGSRLLITGILLTLAGGYLDAYTYVSRGGVFANAQTANIVKLAMAWAVHDLSRVLQLLIPISAFVLGVLMALIIETHHERYQIHHIRRSVLLVEMTALIITSFLPQDMNTAANCLVSFVCAMQMEAFKQFAGQNFTTTVSTGNLRKFIGFSYKAILNRDHESFKIALIYLLIVFTFILGAYSGYLLSQRLSEKAVLIPVALMFICLIIITYKRIYPETKRA